MNAFSKGDFNLLAKGTLSQLVAAEMDKCPFPFFSLRLSLS